MHIVFEKGIMNHAAHNVQTYNGWTNYETWVVNLWLTNDRSTYDFVEELLLQHPQDYEAAKVLKDFVEEINPLQEDANMFSDLLRSAIGEINWLEICRALREE